MYYNIKTFIKINLKGEKYCGVNDSENIYGIGEKMMIREMKEELNYKTETAEETEEIDEVEKADRVKEKKNDFACVFCGNEKGVLCHKGKYICSQCLLGLREENCIKYEC